MPSQSLEPSIHAEVLPFKESPISDRHTIALPTVLMCLIQGSRFGCAGIDSSIPPTKTDFKLARATWLGCRSPLYESKNKAYVSKLTQIGLLSTRVCSHAVSA